ncbi:MAG: tRNA (adenosine(37)-N6)-threonylcarbamoyltransferase complex ATPase subunit type 1 TsaE [Jejuia sp.]
MEITYGLSQIDDVVKELLKNVNSKIILVHGHMGVGKTTLIKSLVKLLGSGNEVSSPTFSIVNEYDLDGDGIYHFDLYRINDIEEAYSIGVEEYLYSDNWIIIEWPEVIKPILQDKYQEVYITEISPEIRKLEIKKDN